MRGARPVSETRIVPSDPIASVDGTESEPLVAEANTVGAPPTLAIAASLPGPISGSVSWMSPLMWMGQPGRKLPSLPLTAYTRADWQPVSQHATPLEIIVYVINKKSQNHYAEQVVKMIGAEEKKVGSWSAGTSAVTEWLTGKIGVPENEYHQADGSGMSRDNRASANAFIHLLRYMWKSPWREDFVSSLPYSGDPDSKFGHRLRQAPTVGYRWSID